MYGRGPFLTQLNLMEIKLEDTERIVYVLVCTDNYFHHVVLMFRSSEHFNDYLLLIQAG